MPVSELGAVSEALRSDGRSDGLDESGHTLGGAHTVGGAVAGIPHNDVE